MLLVMSWPCTACDLDIIIISFDLRTFSIRSTNYVQIFCSSETSLPAILPTLFKAQWSKVLLIATIVYSIMLPGQNCS